MKSRKKSSSERYKVKIKKLATIFSELHIKKCDFLKIDIEGLELPLLKSAVKDNVLKKVHAIVAEINPDSKDFKKTTDLLLKQQFTVTKKKDIINAIR